MASVTYLDTHVVVWAYMGRVDLLSPSATRALEVEELRISPMVLLELELLRDMGRLIPTPTDIAQTVEVELSVAVCVLPFGEVVQRAQAQTWTRDPFDRVIVGQALAAGGRLLTRDETIRRDVGIAFW